MREAEREIRFEYARPGKRVHRLGPRRPFDAGYRTGVAQLRAVAENAESARERKSGLREPRHARQYGPGDAPWPERPNLLRPISHRRYPAFGDDGEQLAQEERVAGGCRGARPAELVVRTWGKHEPHELGDSGLAKGRRP